MTVLTTDTYCRSCGHPIAWGITTKRRRIPIDVYPTGNGNIVLGEPQPPDGHPLATVVHTTAPQGGTPRYTSHFATCPDAVRFRRR